MISKVAKNSARNLIQRFGVDINIISISAHSVNVSTGVITQTRSSRVVKGLFFAANDQHKLNAWMRTNEFPSGIDQLLGDSLVVLLVPVVDSDELIIENRRYSIVKQTVYMGITILAIKSIVGDKRQHIINIGITEYIGTKETINV